MAQERITIFVEEHIVAYAADEASRMGLSLTEYARLMFARGVLLSEFQTTAQELVAGLRGQIKVALEEQVANFANSVADHLRAGEGGQ